MSKQTELDAKAAALLDSEGAMGVARMAVEAMRERDGLPDWVQAGDNTLHGAIDHWQNEAAKYKTERDELAASVERFNLIMAELNLECDCGDESDADPIPLSLWELWREIQAQSIRQAREGGEC